MSENIRETDAAAEKIENGLRKYRLAPPPPELRQEILSGLTFRDRLPWSEMALRWALAMMIITLVWAQWNERVVTERMAGLERAAIARGTSSADDERLFKADSIERLTEGPILFVTVRAPLPPGLATDKIPVFISSVSQLKGGSS